MGEDVGGKMVWVFCIVVVVLVLDLSAVFSSCWFIAGLDNWGRWGVMLHFNAIYGRKTYATM